MEVVMKLARETKNTYRFEAVLHSDVSFVPTIDVLYINKSAFPQGAPQQITVTVK
jgi:hypothetical protein